MDLASVLEKGKEGTSRPATFEDYENTFGDFEVATNNPTIEDLLEEARNPG